LGFGHLMGFTPACLSCLPTEAASATAFFKRPLGSLVPPHAAHAGGLVVKGVGAAHYKYSAVDASSWPPKYCKLELAFGDGTRMAFCDSRRFARVSRTAAFAASAAVVCLNSSLRLGRG
jgi:hypothetical protein